MIQFACMQTPVRNGNDDRDWNCQNWVGEALSVLTFAFLVKDGMF
jgi:hypothetical protein